MSFATIYIGDMRTAILRLRQQWGYGGERSPVGDGDVFWMRGYSAACEQIDKEVLLLKTHTVEDSSPIAPIPDPEKTDG